MILFVVDLVGIDGGLFGVVIVCGDEVIFIGINCVMVFGDLIVYVEIVVICCVVEVFGMYDFFGCTIYVSIELCLMCLVVVWWVCLDGIVFVVDCYVVVCVGFDDVVIY